jgi:ATP-dependent exoDNAse (exonuclease V) beta subunit
MRLLYVAATRAQDRLILSGVADDLTNLGKADNTWLSWIWQALTEGRGVPDSEEDIDLNGVRVRLQVSSFESASRSALGTEIPVLDDSTTTIDWNRPIADYFPLLRGLDPPVDGALRHLNVSQLTSFSQCPRRYYFRHVLSAPEVYAQHDRNLDDDSAPRENMSAMLRGSVIHRFCENYTASANIDDCLRVSLSEVRRERHQWLKELESDFDEDVTIRSLRRLARNFAGSQMFRRLDGMHRSSMHPNRLDDQVGDSVTFSEHTFVLRRRSVMLSGTIDKLVLTRSAGRSGLDAEIIDFKTDRLRPGNEGSVQTDSRAFDGMLPFENPETTGQHGLIHAEVERLANTYLVQMQSYAIAARLLVPDVGNVSATLHFLDRDFEHKVPAEYLEIGACGSAIDRTTEKLASCTEIDDFAPAAGDHCQHCGYRNVCSTGQVFMREHSLTEVVHGLQPESLDEIPYT